MASASLKGQDDIRVSVTEVRNALLCPRVYAIGKQLRRAVTFPIGASTLGSVFHRICEQFARSLIEPPPFIRDLAAGAQTAQVERAVSRWLLSFLLKELKSNGRVLLSMPAEVDDLAEALRRLAAYLAEQIAASTQVPAQALSSMVKYAEQSLESRIPLENGVHVRLAGRIDVVHDKSDGQFDIIEYKLSDDSKQHLDQAQAALYVKLLRDRLGIQGEAVILRFNPGLIHTRMQGEATSNLMERRLLPLLKNMVDWTAHPARAPATECKDLCPACPVRSECQQQYGDHLSVRDTPPANAHRPRPAPGGAIVLGTAAQPSVPEISDASGPAEAEALRKRIVDEFKTQGVSVQVDSCSVGPAIIQIEVKVGAGQRVAALDSAAKDVEHHLTDLELRFRKEGAHRFIRVPRRTPRRVELTTLLAKAADYLRERPGRFVLGEQIDGEPLCGDLSDGGSCHLLVAGQTGSGKSVLLRAIISSLCHYHPPDAIRFTLADPKRVTFEAFSHGIAAHLAGPIRYNIDEILPELDSLTAEMEYRYALFQKASVDNIDDYNAKAGERLSRRVLVVDEFQDLMMNKATRQRLIDAVNRIGAKARAAGIHLILATQRPDRNTVPGEIKANLGGRVALRVQASLNSIIILGRPGAEELLGKGDLLAALGQDLVRAQAPWA